MEAHCDGVDLNLGCPQHIAKRGHYGAYLMEDWPLIFRLVNTLHLKLRVPVTAKMRVWPSVEKTVAYAQLLERAGAQVIAVHGRTREMKGHNTGLADWRKIRAVKQAVKVPVIANGNVLYPADVEEALRITGADAVMSAEGNLYTPTIFAHAPTEPSSLYPLAPKLPFPDIVVLANEYLDVVAALKTPTAQSAIRSHLFRLCRPALEVHRELRKDLGQAKNSGTEGEARIDGFRQFLALLNTRLDVSSLFLRLFSSSPLTHTAHSKTARTQRTSLRPPRRRQARCRCVPRAQRTQPTTHCAPRTFRTGSRSPTSARPT